MDYNNPDKDFEALAEVPSSDEEVGESTPPLRDDSALTREGFVCPNCNGGQPVAGQSPAVCSACGKAYSRYACRKCSTAAWVRSQDKWFACPACRKQNRVPAVVRHASYAHLTSGDSQPVLSATQKSAPLTAQERLAKQTLLKNNIQGAAILGIIAIVLGAWLMQSCGSQSSSTKAVDQSRCLPVSQGVRDALTAGLQDEVSSNSLGRAAAVRSKDFEKVWFVAAEINGPGLNAAKTIGLWATNAVENPAGDGTYFAIDGYAQQFSSYPPGSKMGISISDDGAQQAMQCLKK